MKRIKKSTTLHAEVKRKRDLIQGLLDELHKKQIIYGGKYNPTSGDPSDNELEFSNGNIAKYLACYKKRSTVDTFPTLDIEYVQFAKLWRLWENGYKSIIYIGIYNTEKTNIYEACIWNVSGMFKNGISEQNFKTNQASYKTYKQPDNKITKQFFTLPIRDCKRIEFYANLK